MQFTPSSEALEELLTRIRHNNTFTEVKEEAIRQAVILPILKQLAWNTEDPREVDPEFRIENDEVDYCLKLNGREEILIECKRGGEFLGKHEEQLLKYTFGRGVQLAVLTNGLEWWLYLPLKPGPWKDRKFFSIDIAQQEPASASNYFRQFLGREAVRNGSAVESANKVLDDNVRARKTAETLPKVWAAIWGQPDDLPKEFLEFIRQKVESNSGYQPTEDEIVKFLSQIKFEATAINSHTPKEQLEPKAEKLSKRQRVREILRDGEWHSSSELRKKVGTQSINSVLYALEAEGMLELQRTSKGGNIVRLKHHEQPT